ncbi:MAG: RelA/SpoT family protein [Candidatus Kerfeldbacteria bacterium]|nr:RelA/SpoT family protein [Candidatus Kerfeldbacteria bacterium]
MEGAIQNIHGKTIDDVVHTVQSYHPSCDGQLIREAFIFAKDAHGPQLRKSGMPYIVHPLGAAMTLADLGLDERTIAATLLHDVPEDTEKTLEDIEARFGKEIATLVEGITKLGKLKYRGADRYVENLRRMFVAMAQDVRVILIKFADRIDNLETLDALPPEKQKRVALESLEIFAPIANRLGMGIIKGRIEDLAFPYVYPEEYKWLTKKILPQFKEKEKFVEGFQQFLMDAFTTHDVSVLSIHGRAKHLFSTYKKLIKHQRDIEKVYDLVAVRVLVPNIAMCYAALGIVHEVCKPLKGRIKDYIAQPKPNGYQSLHTTVFAPPQFIPSGENAEIIEIQIRTPEMHEEAEYGIAAHWKYKERPKSKGAIDQKMAWVRDLAALQIQEKSGEQFLEDLKIDFFQNHIFVFTPRGDVIELPEEATPVDFAYRIHSDLGNTCSGVRINDQQASLDTTLKNGDVVEILVNPQRKGPSADWLEFVKTNNARHHIRSYTNKKNRRFLDILKIRPRN